MAKGAVDANGSPLFEPPSLLYLFHFDDARAQSKLHFPNQLNRHDLSKVKVLGSKKILGTSINLLILYEMRAGARMYT